MPTYKKRHYRVVERDKALDNEYDMVNQETLKNLSLLGIFMYIVSIFISFMLGHLIGKQK